MKFVLKKRASSIVLVTFAASSFLLFATRARAQSMPGYQPSDKGKPTNELSNSQKAAQGKAPLVKIYDHLKPNAAKIMQLPSLNLKEKKRKSEKQLQIGVTRALPTALNPLTDSALYSVAEGDVRVSEVVSTGALYTRLHFKDMSLPNGARVFVYSASNPDQFAGPYEGRGPWGDGMFWTPPVPGDTAIVEYFTPAGTQSSEVPFKVSEVSHVYKDVFTANAAAGSCNLEITPAWTQVAKSVGMLDFVSGGAEFSCTGTLLNDAAQDQKPFVLTANHCINTQSAAQSVVVYWNYLTGDFPSGTQTTTGSNLLVTGTASDFSLLLLTGSVPTANLFFSGWDANPVSPSTAVTGIHHPEGSHKRISFGATNANCVGGLPGPCQNFTGVTWSQGVTEPGSSGSGTWTGNGDPTASKLVGQLFGGESSCSTPTSSDYYGRFSVTYPSVAGFLNGSCVTSLSPTSQGFSASGGSGSVTVNAPGGCNWTASSTDAFVTITSGNSGSGSGTVNFNVAANPNGVSRIASIVVGSQVFTIVQLRRSDGSCAPTPINLNQTINGNLQAGCPLGDGSYVDAYNFNANAGQQVVISMSSAVFDTFLYLLNTDGTILAVNDDNGGSTNSRIPPGTAVLTLPNTGAYTILANSFDPGVTGAYTLTLSMPQTLTIASSNPNSGVTISVTPADTNGISGNGITQFTRTFAPGVFVNLNAPGTAGTNIVFLKWQKDGVDYSTSSAVSITMDAADHTMTAVYGPTPTFNLTVLSTNPTSGVPMTVSPSDNGNLGNGSTPFTHTYNRFTQVTLTAPINSGVATYFQKWQENGNDLSTVRTINVNMNPDRTLTAVYVTLPPTPTPTPTPSEPGKAVAFQIDPAHTGFQFDTTVPPLTAHWSRDLGNPVSYPLIAGGKVFVTTIGGLYALDATNGATLWSTGDLGAYPLIAYDAGRVFVTNYNGVVRAFDATTGAQLWSKGGGSAGYTSAPTAAAATVYVAGPNVLSALSEQDGSTKWSVLNAGGDHSSPAVLANAVFTSYSCNNVWALSPTNGSVLWHHTSSCFGGGGRTAVLFAGRIYARDLVLANATLDAGTGTQVDEFLAGPAPSFNGSTGYFLNGATLQARDVTSGNLKWSFTGDGTLSSAPIVVNGYVYVGSTSGKLYAVNESSGANPWTGTVGAAVNRPDEQNVSQPLTGLGAGEGLIVVPASNLLVAYQSSPQLMVDGNNRAIAVDSVTFVKEPFSVTGLYNFSQDQRTRIAIFTTNLGLSQPSSSLSVFANSIPLTVEGVGTAVGAPNLSYIVVKLDPALSGEVQVTVIFSGTTTNSGLIHINP